MPEWLAVILLGIVEGITEFLPISSTGHLLLCERWLGAHSDLFNIVIQCGAVIAVLPLFPERCRQAIFGWTDPKARSYLLKMVAAFVLTGVGGLILEKRHFKLPEDPAPIAVALLVGGVLFIAVEYGLRRRPLRPEVSWPVALLVGAGQLIAAVFPGSSRSGTTILMMLICGVSRPVATEFSFLVGVPTMLAAGGLKIVKQLRHAEGAVPEDWRMLALCTLVSAVVSFLAVRWLLRYVQSHSFAGFGWYRIGLGLLVLWLFLVAPAH